MHIIEHSNDHKERIEARATELQSLFDRTYAIDTPTQEAAARALEARIGVVDWQEEGYASPDGQRDLSVKFHWGHNHRFSDAFALTGRMSDRHITLMAEFIESFGLPPDHFSNKDILDVGCWTGGTSLLLNALGAKRVQALEEVRKYANAANSLFSDVYGLSDVSCANISLYQFEAGTYDHVYFPGVVYHLSDPVLGLRRLYNRLRDGGDILVESQGIVGDGLHCRFDSNRALSGDVKDLNRGGWNWFSPTAACLGAWMETAGFEDVQVYYSDVAKNRVFGYGRRNGFRDITRAGLSVRDIP
ncbi:MAG: DUF1698 domain-containing protein [Pseudomonadota bacterium]